MVEVSKIDLPSFYGIKAGMTRIFDEDGNHVPVTVVKIIPNYISQVKTISKDGYEAYQIAYCEKRDKLIKKPMKGHINKANIDKSCVKFAEVKIPGVDEKNLGKEVSLGSFPTSTYVDVTATTKGKGFQGVMKRYKFQGGPASHGSHFHRRGGAVGNRATPGRIYKGKKMAGHMGSIKRTVQNLLLVELNEEKGYLLIKGSVPGPRNSFVRVTKATKK